MEIDSHTTSRRGFWILILVALSYMTVFMQRTGPGVITDQLQAQFHVTAAVLGAMASVQYFLYMFLQIPVGLSGDKFGPERLFVTGVLLDGIGTLIFARSHLFIWLLVGRAVVGLGDALIWVNVVLILGRRFRPTEFGRFLAVVATSGNVGALLTTIPFASWVAVSGWRIPFTWLGILLAIIAVFDYLVLRQGDVNRYDAPGETTQNQPTIPVRTTMRKVIRDRIAWSTFLTHFGAVGTYIGFTGVWAIPYFMNTYHLTRAGAATLTMVAFIGAIIGGPLAGSLTDKLGQRRKPYMGFQLVNTVAWLLIPLCGGQPPEVLLYFIMFILGLGNGASLLTFAVIRDLTPQERAGVTSGFANTGGFLSAVLFPVVFGFVIDVLSPANLHGTAPSHHAYAIAFFVPTLFSLLGFIGSLCIREHKESSLAAVSG